MVHNWMVQTAAVQFWVIPWRTDWVFNSRQNNHGATWLPLQICNRWEFKKPSTTLTTLIAAARLMAAHFSSTLKHRSAATDCLGIKPLFFCLVLAIRRESIDRQKYTVKGRLKVGSGDAVAQVYRMQRRRCMMIDFCEEQGKSFPRWHETLWIYCPLYVTWELVRLHRLIMSLWLSLS